MTCPHCENAISADDQLCPVCNKDVRPVPRRSSALSEPNRALDQLERVTQGAAFTADERLKSCPYCAERIMFAAVVCKHCKRDLSAPSRGTSGNAAVTIPPAEDLAQMLLALPLIACLLIWFWVGSMNLFQGPASSLTLIGLATVAMSALLTYLDAKRLGIGSGDSKNSAASWALVVGLLWIFGYPMYLHQRRKHGAKSYALLGAVLAVMFVLSWFGMSSAIESRQASIRNLFQ